MSPLDIIELPGQPGKYGRRALVAAWQAAGSPPVNKGGAGRLYDLQKYFWDGWAARLPGFNPADNPDDEAQRLAHVRFGGLDIDPTPERVRRLSAAGLIRPYPYEPWHWELPNVRQYAIVRTIPTTTPTPTESEEDDMPKNAAICTTANDKPISGTNPADIYAIVNTGSGYFSPVMGLAGNPGATDLVRAFDVGGPVTWVSKSHYKRIEADSRAVRTRTN